MKILLKVRELFLLFIVYAVCGWVYEVMLTALAYGYFQNRGFLFGPWLPIYGFGGILLYVLLGRLVRRPGKALSRAGTAVLIFICICLTATAVELAASYILDALGIGFLTLWDYFSENPNFEGRISLISSLRFGVIGTAALYLSIPLIKLISDPKHSRPINVTTIVLAVLFFTDLALRIPFGSNMA